MTSFKRQFWGIKRLNGVDQSQTGEDWVHEQITPYLDWRVLALETNAILLCGSLDNNDARQTDNMVIIEGKLMEAWLAMRKSPTSTDT